MGSLKVGSSKVSITPSVGVTMDGYFGRSPSTGIHDEIFARSLVLTDSKTSVAITSCDLCFVNHALLRKLRCMLSGEAITNLMIVATHNHSGPSTTDFLVDYNDATRDYLNRLPERIYQSILSAYERVDYATGFIGTSEAFLSVNRRKSHGLIDPQVITVSFENSKGEQIASIVNYACHPTVLGARNLDISAEYPGICVSTIEQQLAAGAACLFLNGACGDVNPYSCTGMTCNGSFADVSAIGGELGKIALGSLGQRKINTDAGIRYGIRDVCEVPPYGMSFQLSAFSLGELTILGIPGELFAWSGLELKKSVKSEYLLLSGYTNGYYGYFPTVDAYARRDYETKALCWVDSSGEARIRQAGVALANGLVL